MYCHVTCNHLQCTPTLSCIVYVACDVMYDMGCMCCLYTLYEVHLSSSPNDLYKGCQPHCKNTPS
ncbi:hypothetical protein Scep_015872 [Stephania cephalantha]|uniref:Uncharacterized protein n=1 Tax=Stephania cephalantha TaxID=152367 RepID=A0AAP0J3S3_9MAGN